MDEYADTGDLNGICQHTEYQEMANGTLTGRLKHARKARGFTQEHVAALVSRNREEITMWETGQRIPNQEQIQQIADACQVPVGYLLGTEQPDFPRWARQHFRDMLSEHDI